jgi:hypothetical protein
LRTPRLTFRPSLAGKCLLVLIFLTAGLQVGGVMALPLEHELPAVPQVDVRLFGLRGEGGYFRSPVAVMLAVVGGLRQDMRLEYRLNGREWVPAESLMITADGAHGLEVRLVDRSGTLDYQVIAVRIDTLPPQATLSLPDPEITIRARGRVVLAGEVSDHGSGVAGVEISLDGGQSWQALPVVNERWRFDWDTARLADGRHRVIVRAWDLAGNLQSPGAALMIVTANLARAGWSGHDLCELRVCSR